MRTAYPSLESGESDQPLDIALTTNGHLLESMAVPLKAAGLSRITVSMDAVDAETFTRITRVPRSFERVLAGIRAARDAGLGPVKVNCVLLRGFNDDQIERFAEFSRTEGVIVRFIEWMPLEEPSAAPDARNWKPETVVTMDEIVTRLNAWRPLVDLEPNAASETARRFTFDDGIGEIGIIAPVSRPFCGHLQPHPAYLGLEDPDLPVLTGRSRSLPKISRRQNRFGVSCVYPTRSLSQRGPASHRRSRFSEACPQYGAHRRLRPAMCYRTPKRRQYHNSLPANSVLTA